MEVKMERPDRYPDIDLLVGEHMPIMEKLKNKQRLLYMLRMRIVVDSNLNVP